MSIGIPTRGLTNANVKRIETCSGHSKGHVGFVSNGVHMSSRNSEGSGSIIDDEHKGEASLGHAYVDISVSRLHCLMGVIQFPECRHKLIGFKLTCWISPVGSRFSVAHMH